MKKLILNVDELEVSTFEAAETPKDAGTVIAHATQGNNYTCDPQVGTCFGYTCIDACF